ncbi:unnamed protein product [Candidatus Protochlamydia amoebophila UWE25]|uniref:Uncharacterized protein n=1 Tax=Protochlamydia amoebophila (strain UWE25) TaxID=264201 RepID=Q6MD93_PARUW|nr:unnamed protein product [Candidatus Protochlamydia amoebophila UWE25]
MLVEIHIKVAFGVTMSSCGLFLCVLPIPQAKLWSGELAFPGLMMAVDAGLDYAKEKQNKKK